MKRVFGRNVTGRDLLNDETFMELKGGNARNLARMVDYYRETKRRIVMLFSVYYSMEAVKPDYMYLKMM